MDQPNHFARLRAHTHIHFMPLVLILPGIKLRPGWIPFFLRAPARSGSSGRGPKPANSQRDLPDLVDEVRRLLSSTCPKSDQQKPTTTNHTDQPFPLFSFGTPNAANMSQQQPHHWINSTLTLRHVSDGAVHLIGVQNPEFWLSPAEASCAIGVMFRTSYHIIPPKKSPKSAKHSIQIQCLVLFFPTHRTKDWPLRPRQMKKHMFQTTIRSTSIYRFSAPNDRVWVKLGYTSVYVMYSIDMEPQHWSFSRSALSKNIRIFWWGDSFALSHTQRSPKTQQF